MVTGILTDRLLNQLTKKDNSTRSNANSKPETHRSRSRNRSKDGRPKEGNSISNLQDRLELIRANGTLEDLILENQLLKSQTIKVQSTGKAKLAPPQNSGGKKEPLEKTSSNETNRKKAKGNQSPKQDLGNESKKRHFNPSYF